MTKYVKLLFIFICLIIATQSLAACAQNPACGNLLPADTPQEAVDYLRELQPYEIPEHLQEYDCVKTGEEFDVNEYFCVLSHLSMEPGYVLDYVYFYDFFGGRPIIYVREEDQEPFANYSEYEKEAEQNIEIEDVFDFVAFVMYGSTTALGNKIHIDGTEEGFLEYVVLQIMGGQFYLWWHANYDDATVICNDSALEKVLAEGMFFDPEEAEFLRPLVHDVRYEALKLDVTPVVELRDDVAIVTVILFTKWGGFFRCSFTISRDYPHTIIDVDSEVVIEYYCGVDF